MSWVRFSIYSVFFLIVVFFNRFDHVDKTMIYSLRSYIKNYQWLFFQGFYRNLVFFSLIYWVQYLYSLKLLLNFVKNKPLHILFLPANLVNDGLTLRLFKEFSYFFLDSKNSFHYVTNTLVRYRDLMDLYVSKKFKSFSEDAIGVRSSDSVKGFYSKNSPFSSSDERVFFDLVDKQELFTVSSMDCSPVKDLFSAPDRFGFGNSLASFSDFNNLIIFIVGDNPRVELLNNLLSSFCSSNNSFVVLIGCSSKKMPFVNFNVFCDFSLSNKIFIYKNFIRWFFKVLFVDSFRFSSYFFGNFVVSNSIYTIVDKYFHSNLFWTFSGKVEFLKRLVFLGSVVIFNLKFLSFRSSFSFRLLFGKRFRLSKRFMRLRSIISYFYKRVRQWFFYFNRFCLVFFLMRRSFLLRKLLFSSFSFFYSKKRVTPCCNNLQFYRRFYFF